MLSEQLTRFFQDRSVPGVVAVYLHGSRATGTPHRESDVDVGVLVDRAVLPGRAERSALRLDLTVDLMEALGMNAVDVVILNDVPPTLGRSVVYAGVPVYVRDPEKRRAFERDVQLRAPDLEMFLRRMRKIKLEALRG